MATGKGAPQLIVIANSLPRVCPARRTRRNRPRTERDYTDKDASLWIRRR